MTLDLRSLALLEAALHELEHGFDALPRFEGGSTSATSHACVRS